MDRAEALIEAYRRQLELPWREDLSGPERVWMAVYPPEAERRIRARLPEFALATKEASKTWNLCDLSTSFSDWLASNEYRDAYFEDPDLLAPAISRYEKELQALVLEALEQADDGPDSITALLGVGTLFPMVRVSNLIQHVSANVQGRLLVLFPGRIDGGNYRLLDARDGWNYLAITITAQEGTTT